jgi:ADP-ribose pyrophosphatase YjhB (NUDIX family)
MQAISLTRLNSSRLLCQGCTKVGTTRHKINKEKNKIKDFIPGNKHVKMSKLQTLTNNVWGKNLLTKNKLTKIQDIKGNNKIFYPTINTIKILPASKDETLLEGNMFSAGCYDLLMISLIYFGKIPLKLTSFMGTIADTNWVKNTKFTHNDSLKVDYDAEFMILERCQTPDEAFESRKLWHAIMLKLGGHRKSLIRQLKDRPDAFGRIKNDKLLLPYLLAHNKLSDMCFIKCKHCQQFNLEESSTACGEYSLLCGYCLEVLGTETVKLYIMEIPYEEEYNGNMTMLDEMMATLNISGAPPDYLMTNEAISHDERVYRTELAKSRIKIETYPSGLSGEDKQDLLEMFPWARLVDERGLINHHAALHTARKLICKQLVRLIGINNLVTDIGGCGIWLDGLQVHGINPIKTSGDILRKIIPRNSVTCDHTAYECTCINGRGGIAVAIDSLYDIDPNDIISLMSRGNIKKIFYTHSLHDVDLNLNYQNLPDGRNVKISGGKIYTYLPGDSETYCNDLDLTKIWVGNSLINTKNGCLTVMNILNVCGVQLRMAIFHDKLPVDFWIREQAGSSDVTMSVPKVEYEILNGKITKLKIGLFKQKFDGAVMRQLITKAVTSLSPLPDLLEFGMAIKRARYSTSLATIRLTRMSAEVMRDHCNAAYLYSRRFYISTELTMKSNNNKNILESIGYQTLNVLSNLGFKVLEGLLGTKLSGMIKEHETLGHVSEFIKIMSEVDWTNFDGILNSAHDSFTQILPDRGFCDHNGRTYSNRGILPCLCCNDMHNLGGNLCAACKPKRKINKRSCKHNCTSDHSHGKLLCKCCNKRSEYFYCTCCIGVGETDYMIDIRTDKDRVKIDQNRQERKRLGSSFLAIVNNNELLCIRDTDSNLLLTLPGGKCEIDETSEECLYREVAEEINHVPLSYHLFNEFGLIKTYLEVLDDKSRLVLEENMKIMSVDYYWLKLDKLTIPNGCKPAFIMWIKKNFNKLKNSIINKERNPDLNKQVHFTEKIIKNDKLNKSELDTKLSDITKDEHIITDMNFLDINSPLEAIYRRDFDLLNNFSMNDVGWFEFGSLIWTAPYGQIVHVDQTLEVASKFDAEVKLSQGSCFGDCIIQLFPNKVPIEDCDKMIWVAITDIPTICERYCINLLVVSPMDRTVTIVTYDTSTRFYGGIWLENGHYQICVYSQQSLFAKDNYPYNWLSSEDHAMMAFEKLGHTEPGVLEYIELASIINSTLAENIDVNKFDLINRRVGKKDILNMKLDRDLITEYPYLSLLIKTPNKGELEDIDSYIHDITGSESTLDLDRISSVNAVIRNMCMILNFYNYDRIDLKVTWLNARIRMMGNKTVQLLIDSNIELRTGDYVFMRIDSNRYVKRVKVNDDGLISMSAIQHLRGDYKVSVGLPKMHFSSLLKRLSGLLIVEKNWNEPEKLRTAEGLAAGPGYGKTTKIKTLSEQIPDSLIVTCTRGGKDSLINKGIQMNRIFTAEKALSLTIKTSTVIIDEASMLSVLDSCLLFGGGFKKLYVFGDMTQIGLTDMDTTSGIRGLMSILKYSDENNNCEHQYSTRRVGQPLFNYINMIEPELKTIADHATNLNYIPYDDNKIKDILDKIYELIINCKPKLILTWNQHERNLVKNLLRSHKIDSSIVRTVHTAQGLEFSTVMVIDWVTKNTEICFDKKYLISALTRASENLIWCSFTTLKRKGLDDRLSSIQGGMRNFFSDYVKRIEGMTKFIPSMKNTNTNQNSDERGINFEDFNLKSDYNTSLKEDDEDSMSTLQTGFSQFQTISKLLSGLNETVG